MNPAVPPPAEFIVAEVSKNWIDGVGATDDQLISQKFESVIAVNLARGYVLYEFSISRTVTDPKQLNETIIAVFRREPDPLTVFPASVGYSPSEVIYGPKEPDLSTADITRMAGEIADAATAEGPEQAR